MARHNVRNSKGRFAKKDNRNGKQNIELAQILQLMTANALSSRWGALTSYVDSGDPRRNLNDECGYPDTSDINAELLRELYDRNPVAARLVDIFPEEAWSKEPIVFETEDADTEEPFEAAFNEFRKSLRGEMGPDSSWFKGDSGDPLWATLKRFDILSGIGHFGILVIGVDDGEEDLRKPLVPRDGMRVTYLRPYDQSVVDVTVWETDKKNPRYGKPVVYHIKNQETIEGDINGVGIAASTASVHWTRVIHLAKNRKSNEAIGISMMRSCYNRLYDLDKLWGGSAEMFYKGAFFGLSFESHPQLGGDVDFPSDMRDKIEEYMNGLQRYLILSGASAKSLTPQVADPSNHIQSQIDAICIRWDIPKRIFMGTERGELASTQDKERWDERKETLRTQHVIPYIIVPLIDRLIWAGVLPKPGNDGYNIDYATDELTPSAQADLAVKKTQALAEFVKSDVDSVLHPIDYLVRIFGFSQEEADEVWDKAVERIEDEIGKGLDTESNPMGDNPNEQQQGSPIPPDSGGDRTDEETDTRREPTQ